MLNSRRFGSAELLQIIELHGPTHGADWMLPGVSQEALNENAASLCPDYWMPATNRLVFTFQVRVLKVGGRVIVIDTGVGNHKQRASSSQNMINTPTIDWLKAIGAGPERVTDVVNTHLHGDHVGWNTRLLAGQWVPTFPNATYHLPQRDWAAFKSRYDAEPQAPFSLPIGDSVLPIVEAGLARFVVPGDEVAGCLIALAAPGHTPGHMAYLFHDNGTQIIFSGDVIYSPIQLQYPDLNSRWCEQPDIARKTRLGLLRQAAAAQATLLPAHIKSLDGWRVRETAGSFAVAA